MRRQRLRLTGKVAVPLSSGGWELGWFRANAQRKLRLGDDGCLLGGNQVEFRVLYPQRGTDMLGTGSGEGGWCVASASRGMSHNILEQTYVATPPHCHAHSSAS